MPVITLTTRIAAPRKRVFDLARSVDAHLASAEATGERAVAGVTRGLLEEGDEVTWEARHLGLTRRLTVRVTEVDRPNRFRDEMVQGDFRWMAHDHEFRDEGGATLMVDRFAFGSPFGLVGRIVDRLFLAAYLRRFIVRRNEALRAMAETEAWRRFVG